MESKANNRLDASLVMKRLKENHIPFQQVALDTNAFLIVSKYGGRIYGPFLSEQDAGVTWLSKNFINALDFASVVASKIWNTGGDRLWLAPELDFNVADSSRFFETYDLPVEIDPGDYLLEGNAEQCTLSADIGFTPRGSRGVYKRVGVVRSIRSTPNPLSALKQERLMNGSLYCGYKQHIQLTNLGEDDSPVEAWTLFQLPGGGDVMVGTHGRPEFIEYYETSGNLHSIHDDCAVLHATGTQRCKLGYRADCVTGQSCYMRKSDENSVLVIREFTNDPTAKYTMQPVIGCGERGCYSVHIYNDDGLTGGFTEMEMSGKPAFGVGSTALDDFTTWVYFAEAGQLKRIAWALTGCSIFLSEEREDLR